MGKRNLLAMVSPSARGASFRAGRHVARQEKGVVALEFLLAFPFFIYLVLLMVDLGVMSMEYISAANSVREGTRYAAVNCGTGSCTVDNVKTRVMDVSAGILADPAEITVTWSDVNGDGFSSGRGDSVIVSVDHPYDFLFFPSTMSVLACADMRLEAKDKTAGLPSGGGC